MHIPYWEQFTDKIKQIQQLFFYELRFFSFVIMQWLVTIFGLILTQILPNVLNCKVPFIDNILKNMCTCCVEV